VCCSTAHTPKRLRGTPCYRLANASAPNRGRVRWTATLPPGAAAPVEGLPLRRAALAAQSRYIAALRSARLGSTSVFQQAFHSISLLLHFGQLTREALRSSYECFLSFPAALRSARLGSTSVFQQAFHSITLLLHFGQLTREALRSSYECFLNCKCGYLLTGCVGVRGHV
jgi:hypothetical protein